MNKKSIAIDEKSCEIDKKADWKSTSNRQEITSNRQEINSNRQEISNNSIGDHKNSIRRNHWKSIKESLAIDKSMRIRNEMNEKSIEEITEHRSTATDKKSIWNP